MGKFSEETGDTSEATKGQFVLVANLCLSVCQRERSLTPLPPNEPVPATSQEFPPPKEAAVAEKPSQQKSKSCRCFNSVYACKASGFASYNSQWSDLQTTQLFERLCCKEVTLFELLTKTLVGCSRNTKEVGTQYSSGTGSYQRKIGGTSHWTYDELKDRVLCNRETLIGWLMNEGMIASKRACPVCGENMELVECTDRSDGYKWECRKRANNKRHKSTVSIRKGSWFEQSNLTLEEIIKFTDWWSEGMTQGQINKQLHINANTAVDWDMFC